MSTTVTDRPDPGPAAGEPRRATGRRNRILPPPVTGQELTPVSYTHLTLPTTPYV